MERGETLWVLEAGCWEKASYEFRVESGEPLGQHSVMLANGGGRRLVCSCDTRTREPDQPHDPKLDPGELAELVRLNGLVNFVCWSHDDHRPGEIRDEDDEVVALVYGHWPKEAAEFVVAAKNGMDGLLRLASSAKQLERERDEAREWVRRLTAESRVLTCVYCGHAYPPGSPEHGAEVLTEHIKVCEKHPMRALEAELALLLDDPVVAARAFKLKINASLRARGKADL
jgi:hypothetical protein